MLTLLQSLRLFACFALLIGGSGCANWVRDSTTRATQEAFNTARVELEDLEQQADHELERLLAREDVRAALADIRDIGDGLTKIAEAADRASLRLDQRLDGFDERVVELSQQLATTLDDLEQTLAEDEERFERQVNSVFRAVERQRQMLQRDLTEQRERGMRDLHEVSTQVAITLGEELRETLRDVLWLAILVPFALFGLPFVGGIYVGRAHARRTSASPTQETAGS